MGGAAYARGEAATPRAALQFLTVLPLGAAQSASALERRAEALLDASARQLAKVATPRAGPGRAGLHRPARPPLDRQAAPAGLDMVAIKRLVGLVGLDG